MTIRRAIPLAVLASFALLLALAPRHEEPTLPYLQWIGGDTRHEPGFHLIRDEPSWVKLWTAHTGAAQVPPSRHSVPKIDFGQCMVVAYSRGPTTNTDGEELTPRFFDKDALRLRFVSSTFQTSGGINGGAVTTKPFGIWLIPRYDSPIVVEEGRRALKAEPIQYKEVHRFPAAR